MKQCPFCFDRVLDPAQLYAHLYNDHGCGEQIVPAEPKEKCADTTSCKHHLPTSACVKCTPKLPEKVDFVKLETKVKNGRNALIELTIENTLNGIITYLERTTK